MVSPTPNKGYTYPAHGGAVNAWDSPLNSDFDAIDLNLGGTYNVTLGSTIAVATYNSTNATIPSTAASITLPTSIANNLHYYVSGTIGATMDLTFPSAFAGIVDITNSSSGNFSLTTSISGSTATATTVGRGSQVFISDATTMFPGDTNGVQSYLGDPNGNVAGTAATINGGLADMIWDATNQILYFCTTTGDAATAVWTAPQTTVNRGFDTAVNLSLNATHTGGNLLQVDVKTVSGVDPTAGNPIVCEFQTVSGTATTGAVTSVSITAALSMTTNALGASMGTTANVPFRIWLALFNNAGTAVLGMRVCSTSTSLYSLAEYGVASTTGISGAATSAGVWYTPNGTSLTSKAFRIIGYVEYSGGLATAGTYSSDPSNTVLFGPGIKKPGDIVQTVSTVSNAYSSTAATLKAVNDVAPSTAVGASLMSATITPSNPINKINVCTQAAIGQNNGAAAYLFCYLILTGTANAVASSGPNLNSGVILSFNLEYEQIANTTSAMTFSTWGANASGANVSFNGSNVRLDGGSINSFIRLTEIMG